MEVTFSVIVPVYNAQIYLHECVQSVLGQTCPDFELLLVDDGSTDESGALCDGYAQEDARVRVFHQPNAGQAAARNRALDAARGRYVLFLDADDFFCDRESFGQLAAILATRQSDMLCFNYARCTDQDARVGPPQLRYPDTVAGGWDDGLLLREELVARNAFQSQAWTKAVRRSLIEQHALRFPVGRRSGEDIVWNAALLALDARMDCTDALVYAYRKRPGSITRSAHGRNVDDLLYFLRICVNELPQEERKREIVLGYLAFQYCTLLLNWQLAGKPGRNGEQAELRALAWLLRHDRCRIVKMVHMVYRVMGVRATSALLGVYFSLFR